MASIETLITEIDDPALRDKLGREVAEMKKRLDWGLVFERHLPENVRAISAPIKPGSVVLERRTTTPVASACARSRAHVWLSQRSRRRQPLRRMRQPSGSPDLTRDLFVAIGMLHEGVALAAGVTGRANGRMS